MSHRVTVNGKRQLLKLNTVESVPSFPALNIAMQSNISNINVTSKEVSNYFKEIKWELCVL